MAYKTDSKNIGMTGIPEAEYRKFLRDLEALNNQYKEVFNNNTKISRADLADIRSGRVNGLDVGVPQETRDAYKKDFFGLVSQYGINPVVQGTDKTYYLDPGMPSVNPYGPDAQFNDSPGTRPGMYTRDRRTTGDGPFETLLKPENLIPIAVGAISAGAGAGALGTGLLTGGSSLAVGNDWEQALATGVTAGAGAGFAGSAAPAYTGGPSGSLFGTTAINATDASLQAALGTAASTAGAQYYNSEQNNFADSSGNPAPNSVQTEPVPGEGILDWIGEQIMNTPDNAINIPIPGLPFPIPGNMSLEDLWDIAKRTGKSIQEVIAGIGQDPEENPEGDPSWNMPLPEDDEEDVRVGVGGPIQRDPVDEEDEPQIVVGPGGPPVESPSRPGVTPGERPNNRPGVNPGLPDAPVYNPRETATRPGATPGETTTNRPGVTPGEPRNDRPGEQTGDRPGGTPGEQPGDRPGGVPGENGDNNRPGFEAALIGLLPLLSPDPPQREPGEYDLWDYIGADDSYGIQRPNYGTPQMKPLYNFPTQPNQPMQVNNNPQARRDFINPVEAERRRRGLL